MNERGSGFTLVEMAIVLVIIGLLVGGVLSGQQLIQSARVRNLISQQDGIKAAFFGFQDRYRALPGDYSAADVNIACTPNPCINGNGNGQIEAGVGGAIHEEILAWNHLTAAGFVNGSFTMAGSSVTTAAPDNTPVNPYGAYMQIAYDGLWGISSNELGPNKVFKHSIKTGNQIPVEIIAEVDRKIDDGRPYAGALQFSTFSANGNRPDYAGTNDDSCTSTETPTTDWNTTFGQTNCGGASLL
ncbi:MAG TPA: prepilin-type N-terminal cleavage/methylation domain-containing protein [Burkholderiales bacterium]|nr:prepilin-type N-terminal cleavage/methylation domain-containing protein [Burkholderiales bacterium]